MEKLHPVIQALLATSFMWGMTTLGASMVFIARNLSRKMLDGMLGAAGGVMIAASFWSLLAPAVQLSAGKSIPVWFPPLTGFLAGGVFLRIIDRILPHLPAGFPIEEVEGIKTSWRRATLLVLAITLHNIPEGLAVGVAFGAVAAGLSSASLPGAIALTVGIGIQDFLEGLAVSMPLKREGVSHIRSFWYGLLSGAVEPIAGVVGAVLVVTALFLLPYALAFAAGAMIFVVVEEVVPESQLSGNRDIATMGAMLGFAAMMVLEIAVG
ncbi:MAG: ZIP family metal transporter [Candidatus Aureabacteria bacterium]|nr:ZIP family metal transporter [Candidatus Auribacterota bacterium]